MATRIGRREFLGLVAAGGAAASYPAWIEPRWLDVTRTSIAIGLRSPVRILHLTDFHASWLVPTRIIEAAITEGLAAQPDLICLTGDFITRTISFDRAEYVGLLRRLSAARPTFATLGNHDGGAWGRTHRGFPTHEVVERILDEAGIPLLHNRSVRLSIREADFDLVGVGDHWSDEIDPARAFREARAPRAVLLCHNPDGKQTVARSRWDLMLCGHTHGGQVVLPVWGRRFAPVEDPRYVAGLGAWDGRQIFVSRGVGNVGGVRFACRPEASVLELS